MNLSEMKSVTDLNSPTLNNPTLNLNSLAESNINESDDILQLNSTKNENKFKKNEKRSSLSIDFSQPQSMKKRLLGNSNYFNTYNTNTFDIITPIHEKNDITLQTPDVIKCLLGSPETEDFVRNTMSMTPIQFSPLTSFKLFESLDFNTIDQKNLIEDKNNENVEIEEISDQKQTETNQNKMQSDQNETKNELDLTDNVMSDSTNNSNGDSLADKMINPNINPNINPIVNSNINPNTNESVNFVNRQHLSLSPNISSHQTTLPMDSQPQHNFSHYLQNSLMQFPPRLNYLPHPMSHLMVNNTYPIPPNLSNINPHAYSINNQANPFYNNQLTAFNRLSPPNMIASANRSRNLTSSSGSSSDSQTNSDQDKKEKSATSGNAETGDKIDDKKLRNRLAAARCRERKQKRVNQLEEQLRIVLQERNHYKELYWKIEQKWIQHMNSCCNTIEIIKK